MGDLVIEMQLQNPYIISLLVSCLFKLTPFTAQSSQNYIILLNNIISRARKTCMWDIGHQTFLKINKHFAFVKQFDFDLFEK